MELEQIESARLRLREITPEVYKYAFDNLTAPELMAVLGLKTEAELENERRKYEKGMSTYNRSFLYFQIVSKATNGIVGWCGFHTWYTDHKRAEIGYGLNDDSFKQQGIMTEAIALVIAYGFEHMGLNRIEAFVGPDNQASIRLLEKMKFTKEGHLRQHYCKNDRVEDSLVFSLLRKEHTAG